ncbi:MAG: serine/threonine-protein kinase [Polyangiaceae bacterium]
MPGTVRPPELEGASWGESGATPSLASPPVPRSVPGGPPSPPQRNMTPQPPRAPQLSKPAVDAGPLTRLCPECGRRFPSEFRVCPHDARDLVDDVQDDADKDELVGATLGDTYEIIRVLGEGGMGRVYEARHTRLTGKRFAIKVLHPEYTRQPEVISRFQREAEAAASLRSPHVVGVYDVGKTADGRPYMVAEYLEGKELADHLADVGKLPVPQAVRIVRQICKALTLAHAKGVIHRDMKPENVFLQGDMSSPLATVLDFGISKTGDGRGTNLTKTGMIMGTPSYMAPEQARGERVDHRADVYAVGAILYAVLTGKRPFDHADPMVTVTAVLTRDPPPPRSIEPSIPEALELAIQRAMAKEPSKRYASMAEMDQDLAPWDPDAERISTEGRHTATPARNVLSSSVEQKAVAVRMAWPLIVTFTAVSAVWVLGSIVTTIAALIRMSRGGARENLSGTEAMLLTVGAFFVLLTPLVLLGRTLWKTVRHNRMKEVELADRLRAPVVVGLSGYGFATLLVRLTEIVVVRSAESWGWPVWDILLVLIAAIGAAGAYVLVEAEKRRI